MLSFLYSPTLTSIHDYWKRNIALTRWTFVVKVMSLLFSKVSRLVINFLPRSKRLLISWLQSPFAVIFSSVQSLSRVWLFVIPWTVARQASLSITNSWSSLKLMSIESVMTSNRLILCRPLSSRLQSFPASESFQKSQFFASGGPKYWSFSFSISPSNEYSV